MIFSGVLSLGPFNVPSALLFSAFVYLLAYLTGRIVLRKKTDASKLFSELLLSPLLPLLLGWKLSLVLTDFRDVLADPLLILYATGSIWNILIGVVAGFGWLAYKWWKLRPEKIVTRALAGALIVAGLAFSVLFLVDSAVTRTKNDSTVLPDVVLERPEGGDWIPSQETGHSVVLNFWASWCPPCRAEMPMLDRLAGDRRYNDVVFYAVNATGTEKNRAAGIEWMKNNGYTIPVLLDISGRASFTYGISSLPTTIILDSEGRVVDTKIGAVSRSWITSTLRKAKKR